MSQTITITAVQRDGAGKGVARKLRAQGCIPAVVYGHNYDPVALCLNAAEIERMFRPGHEDMEEYQLYKLVIEGKDAQGTMVMIKNIQRHPVKETIQHMDFFAVRMDEKIVAPVHIRVVGKAAGVKNGGILRHIMHEIRVKSLPGDVPPHVDVDVTNLEIGDALHVKDLSIPANVQVLNDPEAGVVSVMAPTIIKEEVPEAAAEAAPAAEQPEGAAAAPATAPGAAPAAAPKK